MQEELKNQLQESQEDWAKIHQAEAERIKKDKRIVSDYCANNNSADIIHTLQLLEKYQGLPKHDEELLKEFKDNYPKTLTVEMIHNYEDIKDIYKRYLDEEGY